MSDNNTEKKGFFQRLFAKNKEEDYEDNEMTADEASDKKAADAENADDAAAEPPLAVEDDSGLEQLPLEELNKEQQEKEPVEASGAADEEPERAVSAGDEIESNAKNFFNSHHADTVENKARAIQAAMSGFADEKPQEDAAATQAEDGTEDDPAVSNAKTVNYDMAVLVKMLKDDQKKKSRTEEAAEEEKPDEDDPGDEMPVDREKNVINEYPHPDIEYTDKAQGKAFFKALRASAVFSAVAMIVTLILTVLSVWFEVGNAKGLPISYIFLQHAYSRVAAMASLGFLTVGAFFNLDGLLRGMKKLSVRRPAAESVAFVGVLLCALQAIFTACVYETEETLATFCFVGMLLLSALSVNTFIKAYTAFKSFAMVLSKKVKLTTQPCKAISEESTQFAKYLGEDADVLSVSGAESIGDFFKTIHRVPRAASFINKYLDAALVVSIAAGVMFALVFHKSVYQSFTDALLIFLLSLPVGQLLSTALPYFAASVRVSKFRSAILGEAAGDFYENTCVMSFDDTEVFPPRSVKVSNIKSYGDMPIDKVILYMAKIFRKVDGPLSFIFENTLQDASGVSTDDVMLVESASDGMRLKIGEDDVLVGKGSYLRLYDVEVPVDSVDEAEMRSLTSILWLVCNGEPAAKFYVRYTMSKNFESLFEEFRKTGICIGVRTCDPGIDNSLLASCLHGSEYPIKVINKKTREIGRVEPSLSGSLFTLSSIHHFLKSFLLVDKLRAVYRSNTVVTTLGSVIGFAAAVCLIFAGVGFDKLALLLLLYHLLLLVPVILLSVFSNRSK